jgi:hypothetical protein
MTFIYIVKKIIGNWINTLTKTHMMKELVALETQSLNVSKLSDGTESNKCC